MHLLIIAGFAGSGKTTFLLELIKALTCDGGPRLAVIENDAGQVGIDDHVLRGNGLPVREIYSGCICCSLRVDLVNTLLELERDYRPDVVILEPSGVAGPRHVLAALDGYGGEIESKRVVTLIDAERFQAIQNFFFPLFTDGIQVADLVVLNKSDRVEEAKLEDLRQRILAIRPDARVLAMSALLGSHVDELVGEVRGWIQTRETIDPVAQEVLNAAEHPHDTPANPAVFARKIQWEFTEPVDAVAIRVALHDLIMTLGRDLGQVEGSMLAHLKAIVKAGQGGYLLGSLTRCGDEPQLKGALPRAITTAELIINVIVYGIEADALAELTMKRIQGLEHVAARLSSAEGDEVMKPYENVRK